MRRRGCLISFGVLAGLALICCVLLIFVGLPRFQDSIAGSISDGLATEVAEQFDVPGGDLQPGTYTISMTELEQQFASSGSTENVDDFGFSAQNGEIILSFGSQGQSFDYSGVPVAENGRLVMTEVEADGGGWLDRLFPADKLADAVEGGVNSYFEAQGLEIVSVTAENDELVIEAVQARQ